MISILIKINILLAVFIIAFVALKPSKDEGLLDNPTSHHSSYNPGAQIMKIIVTIFCLNSLFISNLLYKKINKQIIQNAPGVKQFPKKIK